MTETRSVVIELLSQLGSSKEAREYLNRFSSQEKTEFAVIKVGGGVLKDQLDELAWALTFLHRVGLYPIVLHGAGPQLSEALDKAAVDAPIIDGLRRTTPEAMAVVRPILYEQNLRLVDELEERGVRARSVVHGVFESDQLDGDKYGLVGAVRKIHRGPLRSAIRSGALPIVACLGETSSGQALNVNADMAAAALVEAIQPYKIVLLTPTGGLLDAEGRIISAISIASDYERLMDADWVHSGMRLKLQQIKAMLDRLPGSSSISITSAAHLTKELFTHTGAGTLVRQGERFDHWSAATKDQLSEVQPLIERCFGKTLRKPLASLDRAYCITSQSRRAAAVVLKGDQDIHYLDKFAVTPQARGEGLGAALWSELTRTFPSLYWRSRHDNPINGWYQRQATASLRYPPWKVFAYGVDDFDTLGHLVRDACAREVAWQEDVV